MHRFGWLLIGLGAALLLTKGGAGFLLFPLFFFWPFVLGALFFALFARGPWRGHGWHGRGGPRPYYWRGRHGYYGGGCGPRLDPRPEAHDEDRRDAPRPNTGHNNTLYVGW